MALSAYECWSEGSVSRVCMCPGRVCSGCSALRVSEAVYESVCGFPRSLAYSRLSRDKSRSVPLSLGSPEEMAGSWRGGAEGPPLSDGGWPRSRSLSASSLGPPPSSGPYSDEEESELEERGDRSQVLSATLESLRGIMYRSVPATPGHSRIPVLSRRGTAPALGGWETPGEHPTKESLLDVDKDFSPEYLPFDLQKFLEHKPAHDGTQQRVTELGEQLEEARQLDGPVSSDQEVQTQPKHGQETYSQCRMIQWLTAELHSKGQLYQRTLKLLVQLLSGTSPAADVKADLVEMLRARLKERDEQLQALTHSVLSRGLSRGSQTDSEAEPGSVALRLKEKDNLLVQVLVDQERQAARHQQTTEQLLNCVMERDRVIQELSDSHREAAADLAEQLQALQAQLSARDRELAERRGLQAAAAQECFSELASMRALLEHKDQLILDLLDGGRERDQLLSCLQQHVTEGTLLKVTMKHTL
ncbi:uncharacterized protein si:ch73-95l15.5 [Stegostoma tigrinum]|uniref:uncharacterized protein si:ch73-95l15.5 n=1 Tax=Stegostoma tigrinum TaxID=3053191 RepID=UPI0028705896|nr:uncharacterized protein si:ch73-95l15.5 [Stegostoma tigrinum]